MLSESFIVSTLASEKTLKDSGVYVHEFQPTAALCSSFKKSSTAANGLAITPFHVFAAQAEKAAVIVYNRQKGGLEATVPFPERLRSIAIAGEDVLVLGTEGGKLILWEVGSAVERFKERFH
jgi:pre-rRNA-processing protein IPI3